MKNSHETWMKVAQTVAQTSKDPRTKVGAVIIDQDNRIVSTGVNGMVKGIGNEDTLWENKYPFVIHAEMNAALWAKRHLAGCKVYVTLSPCINCLKHLFQMGVVSIFYDRLHDKITEEERKDLLTLLDAHQSYIVNINTHEYYEHELEAYDQQTRKEI